MYIAKCNVCWLCQLNKLFKLSSGESSALLFQHSIIAVTKNLLLWAWNMKAVLFDLGGVLISAPQLVIARYEKSLGLPS